MFTPAQLALIKAAIAADPVLNPLGVDGDSLNIIRDALNALAVPDFLCWRSAVPVQDIFNAISWDKYTPVDAADLQTTVLHTNRLLLIQTKQMNLQTLLIAQSLDATRANIRLGLRDAVIALPAGALGVAVSAGGASGATVLAACTEKGTRLEKLLTLGPVITGSTTADIRGFQGFIDSNEVDTARRS
jgi:hypothetical protein